MLPPDLLRLLCCPESHQPLTPADPGILGEVNGRIAAGQVKNRGGQPVTDELHGALLRADRQFLYPVRDGIPVLLIDEAIPLPQTSAD